MFSGDLFAKTKTGAMNGGKATPLTNIEEALTRAVGMVTGLKSEEIDVVL